MRELATSIYFFFFFLEEEVDLLEEGDHYFQEICWQK